MFNPNHTSAPASPVAHHQPSTTSATSIVPASATTTAPVTQRVKPVECKLYEYKENSRLSLGLPLQMPKTYLAEEFGDDFIQDPISLHRFVPMKNISTKSQAYCFIIGKELRIRIKNNEPVPIRLVVLFQDIVGRQSCIYPFYKEFVTAMTDFKEVKPQEHITLVIPTEKLPTIGDEVMNNETFKREVKMLLLTTTMTNYPQFIAQVQRKHQPLSDPGLPRASTGNCNLVFDTFHAA